MKLTLIKSVTLITLLIFFNSCLSPRENPNEIELVYVNWTEGIAITHLAKVILEEEMNYEVEAMVAYIGPVYASLGNGDKDAFLDAWLPVTHNDYIQEFGDQIVDLGMVFEKAQLGLVVPAYSSLSSINDLAKNPEQVNNEIIGIDSGAGIMRKTEMVLEAYNLQGINLLASSGPAMTTQLKEATGDREEIVVTGWYPHWMFARFDLKFLEDPQEVYGSQEAIHKLTRKGFAEDHPEAAAFLKKFKLEEEHLLAMLNKLEQPENNPEEVAMGWYQNHPEIVQEWLP